MDYLDWMSVGAFVFTLVMLTAFVRRHPWTRWLMGALGIYMGILTLLKYS